MLAACLIFGHIAGKSAARWAAENGDRENAGRSGFAETAPAERRPNRSGRAAVAEGMRFLGQSAWRHCLVLRSEAGLTAFLNDIRSLKDEFTVSRTGEDPASRIRGLELRNLLAVARMVAAAALNRPESRGGHDREDYPRCSFQGPAKAIVLAMAGPGRSGVRKTVVDPEWPRGDGGLDWHRWG